MQTYNEKAWKEHCLNRIEREPEYLPLVRECARKMNSGEYIYGENDWANIIVQKWNEEYDFYDAHCFLEIWSRIQFREIAVIPIGPISPPSNDKNRELNNKALRNLPEPFNGEFFGGTGEDDGYISWHEPLNAGRDFSETIPPGSLPLEVGYTAAWTTIRHWFYEFGVARWPYTSDRIYLLIRVRDPKIPKTPLMKNIFGILG
jgi:hypothetical protein